MPLSARMEAICHFLFQFFCVRSLLCPWVLELQSQIVTFSFLAITCCTGRARMDRWPDPQLSIWPIKLSKKASSLQIPVLISLPTVWPMGVSDQCQRGEEEEKEGSWRIHGVRGREVSAGQVSDHFSPWGAGEGQQSWLPRALLQGGCAQNESLKEWSWLLDRIVQGTSHWIFSWHLLYPCKNTASSQCFSAALGPAQAETGELRIEQQRECPLSCWGLSMRAFCQREMKKTAIFKEGGCSCQCSHLLTACRSSWVVSVLSFCLEGQQWGISCEKGALPFTFPVKEQTLG